MKKVFFSRVLRGFTAGVALNCVICLISLLLAQARVLRALHRVSDRALRGRTERGARAGVRSGLIGSTAALLGAALHHVKAHKSLHSLLAALFSVR